MTTSPSPKRSFAEANLEDNSCPEFKAELEPRKIHLVVQAEAAKSEPQDLAASTVQLPGNNGNEQRLNPPCPLPTTSEKPAKKPKLSKEEKAKKDLEREEEARVRAEEARIRAEDKAKRAAVKDAEREEKRKIREEKVQFRAEMKQKRGEVKQKKQEERGKVEEERMKKERSQLRLNAFFGTPGGSSRSAQGSPTQESRSPLSSRRSSIAEIQAIESEHRSRSVSATPIAPKASDYYRHFPEFFLQSHTALAPVNRVADRNRLLEAPENLDQSLNNMKVEGKAEAVDQATPDMLASFRRDRRRNRNRKGHRPTLKMVIEHLNGSLSNPIDLTENATLRSKGSPVSLLKQIPMKSLKFAEDVRPPYVGTCTRQLLKGSILSLARKPFAHVRPDTNYDYDSEAEWEEPGEGEDLDSEGEEDLEEDEEEGEMDGFLDDEDTSVTARGVKRNPLLGDLQPACTGICWAGESVSSNGEDMPNLQGYRIDVLLEKPAFPIDPYSSNYWQTQPSPSKSRISQRYGGVYQTSLMEPPRMPLQPTNRTNNTLFANLADPQSNTKLISTVSSDLKSSPLVAALQVSGKATKGVKRYIPAEIVEDFKQAVEGSDLSKVGLIEVLKRQFPKQPKDAIKDTLELVAQRVGGKAAEKKWILKTTA